MQHHQLLILFTLLIFAFGLVSRFAERNCITGPMVFMTVGILGSSLFFGFVHATTEMGPVAYEFWGWRELVYALASLTLLRMIPVAISLLGAGVDKPTMAFIGWFGPRGIASVLYLLMAVAAIGLEGHECVMSVIVLTIMISVYAHGLSATPLSKRYGKTQQ